MKYLPKNVFNAPNFSGLSAGTGKLCIFGHLGLVFIWSCFVSRLLFLLYYVICAPVLTEGTNFSVHKEKLKKELQKYNDSLSQDVLLVGNDLSTGFSEDVIKQILAVCNEVNSVGDCCD